MGREWKYERGRTISLLLLLLLLIRVILSFQI
jgi:hypothetical protein